VSSAKASAGRPGASRPNRRGSLLWLQGLGCGLLLTLATPTALVAGVLLAPTVLALALDRAPGKPTARPLLLLGLAASVRPLATLWTTGHRMDVAMDVLGDSAILATAWVAQAIAWLAAELAPLFVVLAMEAAAAARAARLRAARRHYEEQWDVPPAE
jgi:hypothetical protein